VGVTKKAPKEEEEEEETITHGMLSRFYEVHDPAKLSEIDAILEGYSHPVLRAALKKKYGTVPLASHSEEEEEEEVDAEDATEADMVKGASVFAERKGEYEAATVHGPSKKPGKFALKFVSDGKVLPKALGEIKIVAAAAEQEEGEEEGEEEDGGKDDSANGSHGDQGERLLCCSHCGGPQGQGKSLRRCAYTKALQYCTKECAEASRAVHEGEMAMRLVRMGRESKFETGARGFCDFVRLSELASTTAAGRKQSAADCLLEGWAASWTPAQQAALRDHQQTQQKRISSAGQRV
jgi:hypothetical protein